MPREQQMTPLAAWVTGIIVNFVLNSPENRLEKEKAEKIWDRPLVGFTNGADPLFTFFQKDIGAFYWTPSDAFALRFPDVPISPEALTVISWVLPQTAQTKNHHRKQTRYPCERWAQSRLIGEQFNNRLRTFVADTLTDANHPCAAPVLLPQWERKTSPAYGFASVWSERHTAYACGLGTFGLSDGLITPLGKAVRLGSVVARIDIAPTPRPYTAHNAYCRFFNGGNCLKCAERCPAGAITEKGHDKIRCRQYIREVAAPYTTAHFGLTVNNCGLCQTGVPCASRIPGAPKRK
ncbi:MAG: hypothetical protein ABIL58_22105 [Pseudomonadota bacterium]